MALREAEATCVSLEVSNRFTCAWRRSTSSVVVIIDKRKSSRASCVAAAAGKLTAPASDPHFSAISQRQREAHLKGCLNCVENIEATGEPTIGVPTTRQLPYGERVLFELREAEVKVKRNGQERKQRGDRAQTRVVVQPHEKPTQTALDQLVDLAAGQTDGKGEARGPL
jgi:hypothetical protein